jgi:hypothetical protein
MVLSLPAAGQSPLEIARNANLMGTWALSCASPTIPVNSRITYYAAPNGQLRRSIDRGAGYPILDGIVENIEPIDATTIRQRFRNDSPSWGSENGRWAEGVFQNLDDSLQILTVTGDDGSVFIKDGHLTASGEAAPLLQKCAEAANSS